MTSSASCSTTAAQRQHPVLVAGQIKGFLPFYTGHSSKETGFCRPANEERPNCIWVLRKSNQRLTQSPGPTTKGQKQFLPSPTQSTSHTPPVTNSYQPHP